MTETKCGCCGECAEPDEAVLMAQFETMLPEYTDKPGGLIPALQVCQRLFGYLPRPALETISEAFGTRKTFASLTISSENCGQTTFRPAL